MSMKKINILLFCAVLMTVTFSCKKKVAGEKANTTEAVDVKSSDSDAKIGVNIDQSIINWTGSKIGKSHKGTIKLQSGSFDVKGEKVVGGNFVIDMSSITNIDMAGAEGAGKLEGHLKSPDFFDIAQYPTAKFDITKITGLTSKDGNNSLVYGNLTLKNVTKQISFKANVKNNGNTVGVSTNDFKIDRTDFNVKYGSSKFFDDLKDKAIGDEIGFSLRVTS